MSNISNHMKKAERFIKLWQEADTLEEVAKKLGTTKQYCSVKACNLRRRGVSLKEFKGGHKRETLDYSALNKIAGGAK